MMHKFKYDVSFRISHPDMNPDIICQKLNLQPIHKWCAGDQRKTPKGRLLSGAYDHSYCTFKLDQNKDIDLIDYLKLWNKKLMKYKGILNQIYSSGGKLEYFIGWYSNQNSGEEFDVDFLKVLVELKINLAFDFYGG